MTVEDPEVQALISFGVTPGYNIATAQGSLAAPKSAYFAWGTATGVYTHLEKKIPGTRVYAADGSLTWLYSWTLTNVQLAASQAYFGTFYFADGTNSGEVTWTQPGLNASGSDLVNIHNRAKLQMARIADIAQKGARQGWLSNDDWVGLNVAKLRVQEYNSIKWNDGR